MINRDDLGKKVYHPISRDNLYSDICARPLTLNALGPYGGFLGVREDGGRVDCYAENLRLIVEPPNGLKYKLFIWHHDPFTMMLPRGPMERRVKALRALFHPSCRVTLVEGSTRNNIRLKFISPRINTEWPGWELVALNVGEDQGDAVHEEKRGVRGAYPAKRAPATKAGRRNGSARRKS